MKCISNIGKNISILAKATQVSDVAHGPLVVIISPFEDDLALYLNELEFFLPEDNLY